MPFEDLCFLARQCQACALNEDVWQDAQSSFENSLSLEEFHVFIVCLAVHQPSEVIWKPLTLSTVGELDSKDLARKVEETIEKITGKTLTRFEQEENISGEFSNIQGGF